MSTQANNPVLEGLRQKLRTRMNDVTDHMATGNCVDFAEYKKMCGIIEGLAHAERDLLDIDEMLTKQEQ